MFLYRMINLKGKFTHIIISFKELTILYYEQLFNGQITLVCETNKNKMSFIIFWVCKPHNV